MSVRDSVQEKEEFCFDGGVESGMARCIGVQRIKQRLDCEKRREGKRSPGFGFEKVLHYFHMCHFHDNWR